MKKPDLDAVEDSLKRWPKLAMKMEDVRVPEFVRAREGAGGRNCVCD